MFGIRDPRSEIRKKFIRFNAACSLVLTTGIAIKNPVSVQYYLTPLAFPTSTDSSLLSQVEGKGLCVMAQDKQNMPLFLVLPNPNETFLPDHK
jgi:hypothetical protein